MGLSSTPIMTERLNLRIASKASFVASSLGFNNALKEILKRMFGVNNCYLSYANLNRLTPPEEPRFNVFLERMDKKSIREVVKNLKHLDLKNRKEIVTRVLFYQSGFRNGYVGRWKNGELAYLQWLVYPFENEIIRRHFKRIYHELVENQVMIENAFTYPKFRGLGLLPSLSYRLLIKARDEGYKSAVAYIRRNSIVSLNEFFRLGFVIRKSVWEYKLLGFSKRLL